MIKALKGFVMAAAMMGSVIGVGTAQAIDLRNEDEVAHKVTITSTAMTRDIDLNALTLSLVVCVGECRFEIEGIGTVTASKNDVVLIKDGKITTTPGTR